LGPPTLNGQSGSQFYTRFNEHKLLFNKNNKNSTYAKHLLDKGCAMDPNENTMEIHVIKKCTPMITLDKFCTYKEYNRNNQINPLMLNDL
jgi:hypothetical protein